MQVSMSTLTWLTFPSPGSGRPPIPYAAADLESLLDAAVVAGFTAVGLDNVALGDDLFSREGQSPDRGGGRGARTVGHRHRCAADRYHRYPRTGFRNSGIGGTSGWRAAAWASSTHR